MNKMKENKKENKTIKKVKKSIKNAVSKTKEKYNNMTNTGRKIFWVWTCIFILILALIITCHGNNKIVNTHSSIEKAIKESAVNYAEDKNMHGSKDQKVIIYIEELIENGYLKEKEITDKTCIGYATYYTKGDLAGEKNKIITKSYIKCKKYVTEGYKNQ